MIKRFMEFIKESKTIGKWVESLYEDDYIKNIVNRYVGEITPDIELSNAIDILDDKEKEDIKSQIDEYQRNGIVDKDTTMIASTEIKESIDADVIPEAQKEISIAGKSIFSSFLKSITALGHKEKSPNVEKCPSQFLLFYFYDDLYSEDVKTIFSRFKSLTRFVNLIDYDKNEVSLYFGIKCDGTLEYGVAYERLHMMGAFKLNASTIRWIVQLESKSAYSLKKEIVNLSPQDILLLGKIKSEVSEFTPGYHDKRSKPVIKDKVMSFGYYGAGKWGNGKMDDNDFNEIKNNFSTFIGSKKWAGKVLVSVKAEAFWLYLNIKLK